MTGVQGDRRALRDAGALRFLLLLIGCWTLVRVMAHWTPGLPPSPVVPRQGHAPLSALAEQRVLGPPVRTAMTAPDRSFDAPPSQLAPPPRARPATTPVSTGNGWGGAEQRNLRLALIARWLPPLPAGGMRPAVSADATGWLAGPEPGRNAAPPAGGQPYWMKRQLAGWSLAGWAYGRQGSGPAPEGIAPASQLGGSQAGVRLAYGFGATGRLRAYARATVALAAPRQREVALGLAFAPVARWPVDVAIEQRLALGPDGRTALAAVVSGGVGDIALPHRFRLEAYGQAGVVGVGRRDGFADGALVVDREITRISDASLHLGALAAGSVQPGAARVDVGPRLTLKLPQVGEGSRVAVDWRQRVAGDARPDSGLALTLAADF